MSWREGIRSWLRVWSDVVGRRWENGRTVDSFFTGLLDRIWERRIVVWRAFLLGPRLRVLAVMFGFRWLLRYFAAAVECSSGRLAIPLCFLGQ